MTYRVVYHPEIPKDLSRINRNLQERLEAAISQRLCREPQSYGKPLAATLAGYWKMRVGDYRVIFKVVKNEIWILGIINRRDVYSAIVKRLAWAPAGGQ